MQAVKNPDDFFPEDTETEDIEVTPGFFFVSPNHSNLFMALAKAQAAIEPVVKGEENPYFHSKYADIHAVSQAAKKPLADNDLFYMQGWEKGESPKDICIRTMIGHKSGEYLWSVASIRCEDPSKAQLVGACLTYGKRYHLSGLLGITGTERKLAANIPVIGDDDANIVDMPATSDKVVLKKLEGAALKGEASFNDAWKKTDKKDRVKIAPADYERAKSKSREGDKAPF
jgi:hypothetical protein